MLMLTDSTSLKSVDAISAHNVDGLSNGNVHTIASDMNPGTHPKVIRLDRNQQRENRFWRKQRVREKKQRKWEEEVRKQQEEDDPDGDGENREPLSDNDAADEFEEGDSADELDDAEAPAGISSPGQGDQNGVDADGGGLGDSGYKAEDNDEQGSVRSGEEEAAATPEAEAEHDDGNHSLDEAERDSPAADNEEAINHEDDENLPERDGIEADVEPVAEDDQPNELNDAEIGETGDGEQQEEENAEAEREEGSHTAVSSNNDDQADPSAAADDNEDAGSRPESKHSQEEEKEEADEPNPDADATDPVSERAYRDGYETDDERERTRDERDDVEEEEEERDSAVGGSSEDQAARDEQPSADSADADRPDSEWVGPRSVSPYVEQQLADGEEQEQEQEAADSAVERDSVFSDGEEAEASEPVATASRPESETQRRPPSRVSLVYTYASGPKVLSHVELAPETEAERRPASEKAEKEGADAAADDKNGKHVTFEEDVAAAASVRVRRRRSGTPTGEQSEAKQWKELRKKNKERRKNRTSNTFRSSSTTGSLMNDRRLIKTGNIGTLVLHGQPQPRWNAYFANARALSNSGGPSLTDIIRYQEARRRDAGLQNGPTARRGLAAGRRRDERVRTPPAVAGRKHYRVQTEPYLEEIRDRRLEADRAVQTDPMLDRPSTPLFVPSKTGADVATQIYEGDLFDFELESAPILEVLVGKTVEQSLLEVMEEEELETLREHQRRFEERRQAELAEQQRLAERERRHVEEKDRRMSQRRSALEQETETEAKVAASALAQSYLADMVPAVFSNLRQKGFFFNGIERDIEMTFMPWLRDAVEQELDKVLTGRQVLDELILDAVRKRREELEQRPRLSSRLPPAPLGDPAAGAEPSAPASAEDAAAAPAASADEAAEEDEEEEDAVGEEEEDAAGDEGSDEDGDVGGKGAEEADKEPDDDEP